MQVEYDKKCVFKLHGNIPETKKKNFLCYFTVYFIFFLFYIASGI